MKPTLRFALIVSLLLTLLACSVLPPIAIPTVLPEGARETLQALPSVIPEGLQETLQALPSVIPEGLQETLQALPTQLPEGFQETLQSIPTPEFTPSLPNIQIMAPGATSRVVSPVTVSGLGKATFEQTLVVQVLDQSGAPLATQPVTVIGEMGEYGAYSIEVAFSVSQEQPGRIVVYDASPKDGGLVSLSSVEVTLLPSGTAEIKTPDVTKIPLTIFEPESGTEATSGSVKVKGLSPAVFESTVAIVLCGEGGSGAPDFLCGTVDNILWQGSVITDALDMSLPGTFDVDAFYSATGIPIHARVAVYYTSARDGGILELVSRNVVLK